MCPVSHREMECTSETRLGKYTVVRELGKGGMARVFEGRHEQLGSAVAIKILNSVAASEPKAVARFMREAKAAAQIRHPNVVRVFDIGVEADIPFIVMEFLEGDDLAFLLAQKGAMPIGSIIQIFLPILSAVAKAHAGGIIHRDLKPANVLLARRPPALLHPMILDFGISKMVADDSMGALTRSEALLGTLHYMAPEVTKGARFATKESDQYALGVMLYECVTGKRPFSGESAYDLMHAIRTARVTPPRFVDRSIPLEFERIVLRAMAREPKRRFPSVRALGSSLLTFADPTTSSLWRREFFGEAHDRDPWTEEATAPDTAPPSDVKRDGRSALARAARYSGWLIPPLVAYAGVSTWLLRRPAERGPAEKVASSTPSPRTEVRLMANVPSPQQAEPSAAVADEAESATTTERSKASPSSRPPEGAPAHGAARRREPASDSAVQLGANGAPIID